MTKEESKHHPSCPISLGQEHCLCSCETVGYGITEGAKESGND